MKAHPHDQGGRRILVAKLGGAGASDRAAVRALAGQIAACQAAGWGVVVVHGGGKQLTWLTGRLGLPSEVVGGRRVTDTATLTAAKMAFAGLVGTDLAAAFHAEGISAVAMSGVAGGLLEVKKRPPQRVADEATGASRVVDFGWVGDPWRVRPEVLRPLVAAGIVPLVASLGVDAEGQVYNVNADTVAAALAAALGAPLCLLTDVGGVYKDASDPETRIARMSLDDVERACADGTASGGMLPKLSAVARALKGGASRVCITGWADPGAFTAAAFEPAGSGTLVLPG